jgi:hypothetical protein
LFSVIFYPVLMIYVVLALNAGMTAWLVFALMLCPYAFSWYFVVKKRILNYLKILLDNKPFEWNIEKTLTEYEKLVKKEDKRQENS